MDQRLKWSTALAIGVALAIAMSFPAVSAAGSDRFASSGADACWIDPAGAVWCWGSNYDYELGDGTRAFGNTAVRVQGLPGPASAVAVGSAFACAIVSGNVWCWGQYGYAATAGGEDVESKVPVAVPGLQGGATKISARYWHACAIVSGSLKCWGNGESGALGNGATTSSPSPVQVQGMNDGVTSVSVHEYSTCAVRNDAVYCWGDNRHGRFGSSVPASSPVPVAVPGLTSGVSAVSDGTDFTCAIVSSNVKCWGFNDRGQLGNGSAVDSTSPVAVSGLPNGVTEIQTADDFACAVVGAVFCWGPSPATHGMGSSLHSVPGLPPGIVSVTDYCASTATAPYCWGDRVGTGKCELPKDVALPVIFGRRPPQIEKWPKRVKAGKSIALRLGCESIRGFRLSLKIGSREAIRLKEKKTVDNTDRTRISPSQYAIRKVRKALKAKPSRSVLLTITPRGAGGFGKTRRVRII